MTIAVALKVRDGIVLAADSATTLAGGGQVVNIYNSANKIVNLCKGKPVGFMTWGLGGFSGASIATLAKDFRADRWPLTFETGYELERVAGEMGEFLKPLAAAILDELPPESRPFGFLVAGHTPHQMIGEAWMVEVDQAGAWSEPTEVLPGEEGIVWYGQPKWIQRLVLGLDIEGVAGALVHDLGLPEDQLGDAIAMVRARTESAFTHPAMPIQDAINLGRFLVDTTKLATEFVPGPLTVGGPTEVAAITKHEGFKWVSRKHYYTQGLNPPPEERS